MFSVYQIINLINHKRYIGYTSKTVHQRYEVHKKSSKNPKWAHLKLYRAFNKYGLDNFKIETIAQDLSKSRILELEEFLIDECSTMEDSLGYNMCRGGQGGDIKSKEQKEKLRQRFKESNPIHAILQDEEKTLEWKRRVSEGTKRGQANSEKYQRVRIINAKRLSDFNRGKIRSKQHCANISKAMIKYTYTTPDGVFTSVEAASKESHLQPATIRKYCREEVPGFWREPL